MIAQISGIVVAGKKLGRAIGFPTINVDVSGCALPADGVYIGEAAFHGQQLPCLINQGYQPTLPSGERRVVRQSILFLTEITENHREN